MKQTFIAFKLGRNFGHNAENMQNSSEAESLKQISNTTTEILQVPDLN